MKNLIKIRRKNISTVLQEQESNSQNHLCCHWTNINGLIAILESNTLLGNSKNDSSYIYVSHDIDVIPNYVNERADISAVKIIINLNKLAADKKMSTKESEKLVIGKTLYKSNIIAYVSDINDFSTNNKQSLTKYSLIAEKANGGYKVLSVVDNKGNDVKEDKGLYYLQGTYYKLKSDGTMTVISDLSVKRGKPEVEDKVANISFNTKYEAMNNKIDNISKYIEKVEFAKILSDENKLSKIFSNMKGDNFFNIIANLNNRKESHVLIDRILQSGRLFGYDYKKTSEYKQISHNYKTYSDFMSKLSGIEIGYYKTPSSWIDNIPKLFDKVYITQSEHEIAQKKSERIAKNKTISKEDKEKLKAKKMKRRI